MLTERWPAPGESARARVRVDCPAHSQPTGNRVAARYLQLKGSWPEGLDSEQPPHDKHTRTHTRARARTHTHTHTIPDMRRAHWAMSKTGQVLLFG